MKISAIVMASGQSKRMGENKLFLDLKEKKLFEHTFDMLKELDFDEILVATAFDEILVACETYGFTGLYNDNAEVGKSSSIILGVNEANPDNALMFFVADQPLLTTETCKNLIAAFEENEVITYPVINDRRGAPVIFPPSFRDDLLSLTGDQGGMIFAFGNENNKVEITDETELLDIDTIEAYEIMKETHE